MSPQPVCAWCLALMEFSQPPGSYVLPGDRLVALAASSATAPRLRLGPGMMANGAEVDAVKAGRFYERHGGSCAIETCQRRYVAAVEDLVIGFVRSMRGEQYDVDIGTHCGALLALTAFEGATRKNMVRLKPGAMVYARVTFANKHMEPLLECMANTGKAAGFGVLTGGHVFSCSTGLCRTLLEPDCRVLRVLGGYVPFEVAVGHNGRVWVKAHCLRDTFFLRQALLATEGLPPAACDAVLFPLLATLKNQADPSVQGSDGDAPAEALLEEAQAQEDRTVERTRTPTATLASVAAERAVDEP